MSTDRIYTVEFESAGSNNITTANGDYDLFELDPLDDRPIELCGLELKVTSEVAEAQEEWLRLQVIRGHATDGTGGTSKTPRPLNPVHPAAGFTGDVLRTVIASAGTAQNLYSGGMNVRIGYDWGPVPEGFGYTCLEADGLLVVRLLSTVADDLMMNGTAWVRELP